MILIHEALTSEKMNHLKEIGWSKLRIIFGAAVIFCVLALLSPEGPLKLFLITCAATISVMSLLILSTSYASLRKNHLAQNAISMFLEKDPSPSFLVSRDGIVQSTNQAAQNMFGHVTGETFSNVLKYKLANPSSILFRLNEKAIQMGTSRENIATAHGHLRLSAFQMDQNTFLWRIEDEVDMGGEQNIEGGPAHGHNHPQRKGDIS